MGKIVELKIKVEGQNVDSVQIPADHQFQFKVQQQDGDETRDNVLVVRGFKEPVEKHTEGLEAEFHVGWEANKAKHGAEKVSYFNFVDKHKNVVYAPNNMTWKESEKDAEGYCAVAAFECRGAEPVEYTFNGTYNVTSVGGKEFQTADCLITDFHGIDNDTPVAISAVHAKFVAA